MFTVYRCFTTSLLKYEKDCLITVTRPHKAEQTSHFWFSDEVCDEVEVMFFVCFFTGCVYDMKTVDQVLSENYEKVYQILKDMFSDAFYCNL